MLPARAAQLVMDKGEHMADEIDANEHVARLRNALTNAVAERRLYLRKGASVDDRALKFCGLLPPRTASAKRLASRPRLAME